MGRPLYQPPPEPATERKAPVYVQLKVRDQVGTEIFFKLKRRMPLGLIREAYCAREQLSTSAVELVYRGRRVSARETPEQLQMDDLDCLELSSDRVFC